jgi:tetratricopeptide (TPR) repeat protein
MALLHSFWYEEAEKAFGDAARADSTCAMAHWGIAMSLHHPLWQPPAPAELRRGGEEVERARALKPPTDRERGYVDALAEFYRDPATRDHRTRMLAYEDSLAALHQRHPEDEEVAIFHALILVANAPFTDTSFARQRRAGAILGPLYRAHPDHPGLAHYLIHAHDAPPLAAAAVEAADRYARIAPSVPHARHMPSHIYTRLGMWDRSIASNLSAAEAARVYERQTGMHAAWSERLHALDYLAYAYLQQGRDAQARRVVDEARAVDAVFPQAAVAAHYALAAIPARYALERGRWADAAVLPLRPAPAFPAAEAITHFARAVGAARSGRPALARAEVAALDAVRAQLAADHQDYWAGLVDVQRTAASAWLAHAEGRDDEALRLAASGAEREEATEKHPVTPGAVLPARELQGDLLAALGRPAEALAAYQAVLEREPNRARALFGAARSAALAGQPTIARERYAQLQRLMAGADAARPEPAVARAFLRQAPPPR